MNDRVLVLAALFASCGGLAKLNPASAARLQSARRGSCGHIFIQAYNNAFR